MHRISNGTQVTSLPAPAAVTGTPGYATPGVIGTLAATTIDPDAFNAQQEEIAGVIEAAGITLSKTNNTQLLAALKIVMTGRALDVQVFGTAGTFTYTPPTGTTYIEVEVVGGGGSGGSTTATGASQVAAGSGGGAGGYARKKITSSFSGATITVGGGGSTPSVGASGNNGGASSFGSAITASGGIGGSVGNTSSPTGVPVGGALGGVGASGDINARGGAATYALLTATATSSPGGRSFFGDGGAGVTGSGNGSASTSPGAGGGGGVQSVGSSAGATGGAGAAGIVIVRAFT